MIEEPSRLTVRRPTRRPTPEQIDAFRDVPTGFVVDALMGAGALSANVRPLDPTTPTPHVAGPALTADNGPGDILATLGALSPLSPGDVLVAGFAGHQGCAAAGDRVCGMARNGGAAGFVTDGPMRDLAGIRAAGLPCWCTGLTPASPFSSGPGRVGLPIVIGGQAVDTGDMIVADEDGVVVVPFADIDRVVSVLGRVRDLETALDAKVAAGLAVPPEIVELMASADVAYLD